MLCILLPGDRARGSRGGTEAKSEVPPDKAKTTQPPADDATLSRQPSRHDACSDRRWTALMCQCHYLQPTGDFPPREAGEGQALLQTSTLNPLGLVRLRDPHRAGHQSGMAAKASCSQPWLVRRPVAPPTPSHTRQRLPGV